MVVNSDMYFTLFHWYYKQMQGQHWKTLGVFSHSKKGSLYNCKEQRGSFVLWIDCIANMFSTNYAESRKIVLQQYLFVVLTCKLSTERI